MSEAAPRRVSLVYAGQALLPLKLDAFLDFALWRAAAATGSIVLYG
jgi:hypothetical protein